MNQLLMEFELARLGISGQLWSSDSATIGFLNPVVLVLGLVENLRNIFEMNEREVDLSGC